MKQALVWMLAAAVMGSMVVGCGKKLSQRITEKAMEKAIEKDNGGKAHVDLSKGKMTIKTDKGEFAMAGDDEKGVNLPKDFPSDVYVYDGAKIMMAMSSPDGHNVSMTVKGDRAKVLDTYKQKMTANGWKQETAMDMPNGGMLIYTNGNRTEQVMVTQDEGDSDTTVILTGGKK